MSLEIKRNKKGQYQMKSAISDELLHKGWISEDEAKTILIKRLYNKFIHSVIELDMEFPNGYYVNDKYQTDENLHMVGKKFIIENWNKPTVLDDKFKEICEKLKIDF